MCGLKKIAVNKKIGKKNLLHSPIPFSHSRRRKVIIVPLYKGNGNRKECNNFRGISLLSVPGNINGRLFNERVMKISDKSVRDEQGGLWKSRRCVDRRRYL